MFTNEFDAEKKDKQNFIKEFRAREHMSQKLLLKLFREACDNQVKLTQSQLSDIETGRKPLGLEKAQVMCRIFNCRVEELINMQYLNPAEQTDNAINLNLFSTEQLKTIKVAIDTELQKREALL